MDFLLDKEFWVELIGYASIVSVAIFGLVGALSKEWDRRNELKAKEAATDAAEAGETPKPASGFSWSYIAAMGIILSAVFAMTTSILKDKIAADKKEADEIAAGKERDEQNRRFAEQIARLTELNTKVQSANETSQRIMADMGRSLEAQDLLLTNARQSMLMTAGLTEQERTNTSRVLRTMWDDANRIGASSLMLWVQYRCSPVSSGESFPALLPNASAIVYVAPAAEMARLEIAANTFATEPVLRRTASGVAFTSADQTMRVSVDRSVDGDHVTQDSRFTNFNAPDLRGLQAPDKWRDVVVEVTLRGFQPGIVSEAARLLDEQPQRDEELMEFFRFPAMTEEEAERIEDWGASRLPCLVEMELQVNGRIVATSEGHLVQVWEWDEDVRGLAVARFYIARAIPQAFPEFARQ